MSSSHGDVFTLAQRVPQFAVYGSIHKPGREDPQGACDHRKTSASAAFDEVLQKQIGGHGRRQDPSRRRPARSASYLSDRRGSIRPPFTLQYVAGHDNIETTMRSVRVRLRSETFARLAGLGTAGAAHRVQEAGVKIRCSRKYPHTTNLLSY